LLLLLPLLLVQDVSYGAMEIGHPKGHDDDEEEQEEEYWSVESRGLGQRCGAVASVTVLVAHFHLLALPFSFLLGISLKPS